MRIGLKCHKLQRILILSDSHGRRLGPNSSIILWHKREHNISSIFKPNAKMKEVIKDVISLANSFSKNRPNTLTVVGESNEDIRRLEESYFGKLQKLLRDTSHTYVIVSGHPYRHY